MSFEDLESGRSLYVQGGEGSWRQQTNQTITNTSANSDQRQSIVAGIFQINTNVTTFQRLVYTLGTPKDSLQLRHKLHSTRQQIGDLIKETSVKLKQAIACNQHPQFSATKKIADSKLAKDLQSVLKKFQKAQQLAAQREAAYTPFISYEVITSNSTELQTISSSRAKSSSTLLASKRQELVHLDHEIVFNETIIEEREQGIKEIQQHIGQVNEMFKDLALLVHEQGVILDDISSNVESSHAATAQAAHQLTKASNIQKSKSSMSCLLLVMFGVILLIVILLVVA